MIAAMLSIWLDPKPSSSRPNGTKMRQDRLKEADKRVGTKQGRALDTDVVRKIRQEKELRRQKTSEVTKILSL